MSSQDKVNELMEPYIPPVWGSGVKGASSHRVKLANLDTPIHRWDLPGVPAGYEVFIKRDDMTGSALSGNKVRKLEFLLGDALSKGYKHVITRGGIQSNHCRATAIAAARLGIRAHIILYSDAETEEEIGCRGNLLLDRMAGANMYIIPWSASGDKCEKRIADKVREETGEECYTFPSGGSNVIGMHGYVNAFQELINQDVLSKFDDLVFVSGSGGTGAGLGVANHLCGLKLKLHGILVSDSGDSLKEDINVILEDAGLGNLTSDDLIDTISGHHGLGYAKSNQEELDFIWDVGLKTGIILDPVYTGKGAKGLVYELQHNPGRFRGKRILFLHTGGIFGLYDGTIDPTLIKPNPAIHLWKDV